MMDRVTAIEGTMTSVQAIEQAMPPTEIIQSLVTLEARVMSVLEPLVSKYTDLEENIVSLTDRVQELGQTNEVLSNSLNEANLRID